MLAFSTCWNNSRHTDGEAMIDEILEFGVDHIELSHGMTVAKLPGIRKAFADGRFTCVGVHNYFPSPVEVMIDAPDAYEYTSHRASDRQRAMDMTLKTLEIAAEFKAHYVVLHMGSVPMNPSKWTKALTSMLSSEDADDVKFTKKRIAFIKKREKLSPLYYARAIEALETLAEKAQELGVRLAVESRSRFEDMPTEREMLRLQQHFKDHPAIGYWHDFGHVQLKHNLGLLNHDEWLAMMNPYVIGAHVHDVQWPARDHRVPFTGTLDYKRLLRHFPKGAPMTWELSPTRQAQDIREALAVWRHLFPETVSSTR
ncbi:sugar phosphate isomerase/epimerase family protein [Haloferula rosea]|uniref:TIM barrel protein n=1 Tax=Haloferula rosea TaxID=490093 RepID=A0A934RGZ1_9BACT|nr:TIM barrel protein [Haloferula rosea]MBK1828351.1 TIM barrel protein [Haloferula rosea]